MSRMMLAFFLATTVAAAQAQDLRFANPSQGATRAPSAGNARATSPAAYGARSRHTTLTAVAPGSAATAALAIPAVLREAPRRPRGVISACSEGRRIITAYYASGARTASGERFNPNGLTAAHRTFPFGTKLKVINPRNGQSVLVRINDRGPFVRGVSLDLSLGAAKAIGMRGTGAVCFAMM